MKTKSILNKHIGDLQIIVNHEALAELNHTHQIQEIQGLEIILQALTNNTPILLGGGYFAQ